MKCPKCGTVDNNTPTSCSECGWEKGDTDQKFGGDTGIDADFKKEEWQVKAEEYDKRCLVYEEQGCTRSDAQAIVDAEDMKATPKERKVTIGMTGHWCCGEPMKIVGQTPDGFDEFECDLCGNKE